MEKEKAIEVARYIFTNIRQDINTASKEVKMNLINQLTKIDMEPSEYIQKLHELQRLRPSKAKHISNAYDVIRVGRTKVDPDNKLTPGTFYYHTRLQATSPRPKLKQLESGEFIEVYEKEEDKKFVLRNVRDFTLTDLCDYFHEKMHTEVLLKSRDRASMEIVIKACGGDIDLVLYTIDASSSIRNDKDLPRLTSPIYLMDYIPNGMAMLEDRINTCKAEGIDHEIY
ncbi:MAG TPA: hypothetical protein VI775_02025 [Candidatus Paceibacterota bacterium]